MNTTTNQTETTNQKEMIFLQGLPGSGKSTLAQELFGATHNFIDPRSEFRHQIEANREGRRDRDGRSESSWPGLRAPVEPLLPMRFTFDRSSLNQSGTGPRLREESFEARESSMKTQTFTTRSEAEKHIAERGQAGRKKAQRNGSQWYLVKNESGGITKSVFREVYKVAQKKTGRSLRNIVSILMEADALYDEVKRGLK